MVAGRAQVPRCVRRVHLEPAHVDRFISLSEERYRILLRRQAGEPRPWTQDPFMRKYRFGNVFRDDDTVSADIMRRIVPANVGREIGAVTLARMVNRVDSFESLFEASGRVSVGWRDALWQVKIDTRAYKKHTRLGLNSRDGIAGLVDGAMGMGVGWLSTLAQAHGVFTGAGVAGFISYQCAHDLKGSSVLPLHPTDEDVWCYAGIGAIRGAMRLFGLDFKQYAADDDLIGRRGTRHYSVMRPESLEGESVVLRAVRTRFGRSDAETWCVEVMRELLGAVNSRWPSEWPRWHLSEVEHALCMYDKYMRYVDIGPKGARLLVGDRVGRLW